MDNSRILEAIALRQHLGARYNKLELVLAPHVLYKRNDSYFIDAITILRNGGTVNLDSVGTWNQPAGALFDIPGSYGQPAVDLRVAGEGRRCHGPVVAGGVDVRPQGGEGRGHQRGVTRPQGTPYDGGPVGDRREHERAVGQRLAARE